MDGKRLPATPRVTDDGGLANVTHLFDHIQFAEAVVAFGQITNLSQQRFVFFADVLDVAEPIVHQAEALLAKSGFNTSTPVVSTYDDMLDLEDINRELHDREAIQVRVDNDVSDIAVYE